MTEEEKAIERKIGTIALVATWVIMLIASLVSARFTINCDNRNKAIQSEIDSIRSRNDKLESFYKMERKTHPSERGWVVHHRVVFEEQMEVGNVFLNE